MSLAGALAGGFVGTLVLTTGLRLAQIAGLTRMDIPLLPAVHPRMGTLWSDASESPLLEPPGFMLSNYGRHTALVTLLGHVAYGAIVGGFAAGL